MSALTLIWVTALILMVLAVGWMCSLIVVRLFHERRAARLAADRRAVTEGLSGLLRETRDATRKLEPYIGRARLMADALLDFQGLIRGSDQDRVLGQLRDLGLVEVLAGRLDRGSRAGRLTILEALAALGGEGARAAIGRAVGSSRPEVRLAAIKALADAGHAPSISRLLDYAVSGQLLPSKLYAELVRQVTATAPAMTVEALGRTDLSPALRALALDALGFSGDYHVLPALITAASHGDLEVRTAAVRALGRLQHPAGEPAIGRAMEDESWVVRSAAAEAAGAAGFSRLAAGLDRLLGDPEWWVRFRAGEALVALGRDGLGLLRQAADSERALAGRAAELALAERGEG
jgi:HEAT repeat protein